MAALRWRAENETDWREVGMGPEAREPRLVAAGDWRARAGEVSGETESRQTLMAVQTRGSADSRGSTGLAESAGDVAMETEEVQVTGPGVQRVAERDSGRESNVSTTGAGRVARAEKAERERERRKGRGFIANEDGETPASPMVPADGSKWGRKDA